MQPDVQPRRRARKPALEGDELLQPSVASHRRPLAALALAAGLALVLAGCGQKGRLQPPGAGPAPSGSTPSASAASAPAAR